MPAKSASRKFGGDLSGRDRSWETAIMFAHALRAGLSIERCQFSESAPLGCTTAIGLNRNPPGQECDTQVKPNVNRD